MSISHAMMTGDQAAPSSRAPVYFAVGLLATVLALVYLAVAFGTPADSVASLVGP